MTRALALRLVREPLLHFLLLGAALFALYGWLNRGMPDTGSEIFVSHAQVVSLRAQFERVWQRPATPEELQRLVDHWVREEIFYREGIAMGLDRDDPVVRRRVGQKLEFIIEGALPATPTVTELQAWMDAHPERYRLAPKYTLTQVYFDPSRRGTRLERDMSAARLALQSGRTSEGDSTLLPAAMQAAEPGDVQQVFGAEFAAALQDLPVGGWHGPVESSFGVHLVNVVAKVDAQTPRLEQVRAEVERDFVHARLQQANDAAYERLRNNYRVRVEAEGSLPDPG